MLAHSRCTVAAASGVQVNANVAGVFWVSRVNLVRFEIAIQCQNNVLCLSLIPKGRNSCITIVPRQVLSLYGC